MFGKVIQLQDFSEFLKNLNIEEKYIFYKKLKIKNTIVKNVYKKIKQSNHFKQLETNKKNILLRIFMLTFNSDTFPTCTVTNFYNY